MERITIEEAKEFIPLKETIQIKVRCHYTLSPYLWEMVGKV